MAECCFHPGYRRARKLAFPLRRPANAKGLLADEFYGVHLCAKGIEPTPFLDFEVAEG